MKAQTVAVIEAIPIVVLVALVIAFVPFPSAQQGSSTSTAQSNILSSASSTSTSTAPPAFASVGIAGSGGEGGSSFFTPTQIVVAVGGTVTWSNSDSIIHNVVFRNVTSPDISPGASWSYTFKTAGTYHYYCIYHQWMVGTVVVEG